MQYQEFINIIYEADKIYKSGVEEGLDTTFGLLDDLIYAKRYSEVTSILENIDLTLLSKDMILVMLVITSYNPALTSKKSFHSKCIEELSRRGLNETVEYAMEFA